FEVSFDRRAAIMPNKTGTAESQLVTKLLQPPADVDIIPGFSEDWVKPIDLLKSPLVEGHVATWNMIRLTIRQHDVRRSAGRIHNGSGAPRIFRRQEIVAADS